MIVGVIQSNFIPWRGYFDFIDDVDLFIYHDDLQYTKGDWRNRNKIKTRQGTTWLTVPVTVKVVSQLICETKIDYSKNWVNKVKNLFVENYRTAPFFGVYFNEFIELLSCRYNSISDLNVAANRWILDKLKIKTTIRMSSEFNLIGSKTDRLVDLLTKVKATGYLSGPSAANYLELEKFQKSGLELMYKSYVYPKYLQQYNSFEPFVSVLDLLLNCGNDARNYLKSREPNIKVIS